MKIGVLELSTEDVNPSWPHAIHNFLVVKQHTSIMTQAVSVWCRNLGHKVYFASYFGQSDPGNLLPDDLNVVFISCFSRGSALAYSLAKRFKLENNNILTVIGGPHAKQFPQDALRYFDVVVKGCDKLLIKDILEQFPKGEILDCSRPLDDIPSIEERIDEIRIASFWQKRPNPFVFIPILSSTGCPYSCDFCVDWDNPYNQLPLERVEKDLEFMAKNFPKVRINFYDPNFGVNYDQLMPVIERTPHPGKRWFLTEGSLTFLTEERIKRLKAAGCLCVMPGIESWTAYSKKAGFSKFGTAKAKLNEIVRQFEMLHEHIPIIQANLLFGLDTDKGEDPIRLHKEFITRTPYVMHTLNIPAPFGGTPLFKKYYKNNRILESMPFAFYCKPYLATTLKHYNPVAFYEKLIDIFSHMTSYSQLFSSFKTSRHYILKGYSPVRAISLRLMIRTMKKILHLLKTNRHFLAFHEGESNVLPEFYHQEYERLLGPYASLMSRDERLPVLSGKVLPKEDQFKKTGS